MAEAESELNIAQRAERYEDGSDNESFQMNPIIHGYFHGWRMKLKKK